MASSGAQTLIGSIRACAGLSTFALCCHGLCYIAKTTLQSPPCLLDWISDNQCNSLREIEMATYGYARVSTQRQADEGESLAVQQRQIGGYATMIGVDAPEFFVEEGVSAQSP